MKSGISITLLLLYIAFLFKGLFPYIEYSLNYDYISTELCINLQDDQLDCKGKCYLNSQINLFVGSHESGQSLPLEPRTEVKDNSHTLVYNIVTYQVFDKATSNYTTSIYTSKYNVFLELVLPPPKLA